MSGAADPAAGHGGGGRHGRGGAAAERGDSRLRSRLREEAGINGTGLSVSQMSVLWQVLQEGPVTAAELAAAQHVSPQAIAQNLAVLKAAGLIHAERDPGDGRKTLITASKSGQADGHDPCARRRSRTWPGRSTP